MQSTIKPNEVESWHNNDRSKGYRATLVIDNEDMMTNTEAFVGRRRSLAGCEKQGGNYDESIVGRMLDKGIVKRHVGSTLA